MPSNTEAWCVRSVVTDGSGHSITDVDCMPRVELDWVLRNLSAIYNERVTCAVIGAGHWQRWTFEQRLSDGRRVTDMIIANKVG